MFVGRKSAKIACGLGVRWSSEWMYFARPQMGERGVREKGCARGSRKILQWPKKV